MTALAASRRDVFAGARPVAERRLSRTRQVIAEVSERMEPVILRGFVDDWPLVAAARESDAALIDYLAGFDRGASVPVSVGPPSLKGRIFYNRDFTGLNVDRGASRFSTFLQQVLQHGQHSEPPVVYMASVGLDEVVPGLSGANGIDFGDADPLASIWIGTRTRIAAHNDLPLNLACVAAGRRRFTLFPPDQTPNLYVGPFELTPAGRPISLVDFQDPDFDRFPRFADALQTAQVAELGPGDALFIPSMWWHHVEAFGTVNVLVNYWWRTVPAYLGTPQDVLNHAMLTLRDLPLEEKRIWRDIFEHYVFGNDADTAAHIPERIRGILDPIDEEMARRVRGFLAGRLGR
jgi:hypothetical protein